MRDGGSVAVSTVTVRLEIAEFQQAGAAPADVAPYLGHTLELITYFTAYISYLQLGPLSLSSLQNRNRQRL